MATLEDSAIQAALTGSWQHAIVINEQILANDPDNIDALNRVAYANAQIGKYKEACELYNTILQKEPYHPIAKRCLDKYKKLRNTDNGATNGNSTTTARKIPISPSLFVSDAHKTRIVNLINLAPVTTLRAITAGQVVFPFQKGFEIHIRNDEDHYLGTFPDDVGRKLMPLLKRSKPCECFVKDAQENSLTVFVKWHE